MKFKAGDILKRKNKSHYLLMFKNEWQENIIILNIKNNAYEKMYHIASYPESNNNHSTYVNTYNVDISYNLNNKIVRDEKISLILDEI